MDANTLLHAIITACTVCTVLIEFARFVKNCYKQRDADISTVQTNKDTVSDNRYGDADRRDILNSHYKD